jgi:hypothetical protein
MSLFGEIDVGLMLLVCEIERLLFSLGGEVEALSFIVSISLFGEIDTAPRERRKASKRSRSTATSLNGARWSAGQNTAGKVAYQCLRPRPAPGGRKL